MGSLVCARTRSPKVGSVASAMEMSSASASAEAWKLAGSSSSSSSSLSEEAAEESRVRSRWFEPLSWTEGESKSSAEPVTTARASERICLLGVRAGFTTGAASLEGSLRLVDILSCMWWWEGLRG